MKEKQAFELAEKLSQERKHKDKVDFEIKQSHDWLNRIVWNNPKMAQDIIDEVFEEEERK